VAQELLAELTGKAGELELARPTVLHALRRALTGAEKGVGMHYVVAAIERADALARCGVGGAT
jgi:hypothetical protein